MRASGLPVLVDGDTGYGEALNVARMVRELEDAEPRPSRSRTRSCPRSAGHLSDKRLVSPEEMARKVAAAVRAARHLRIVARTDALDLEGLDRAIARARLYQRGRRARDLPGGAPDGGGAARLLRGHSGSRSSRT